jgi:hypothetical protein
MPISRISPKVIFWGWAAMRPLKPRAGQAGKQLRRERKHDPAPLG